MTYEELWARIIELSITPEANVVPSELTTALLEVLELHKPVKNWYDGNDEIDNCKECQELISDSADYPCETIKAIERMINA